MNRYIVKAKPILRPMKRRYDNHLTDDAGRTRLSDFERNGHYR